MKVYETVKLGASEPIFCDYTQSQKLSVKVELEINVLPLKGRKMLEIKPFHNEYVEEAAKIFTMNYKILCEEYNELSPNFENKEIIKPMLRDIIKENPSVVALSKNKVVGYLTGYSKIPKLRGSTSGVYIPEWAHSSVTNEKEGIYSSLYKFLAKKWVYNGCYTHILTFFANDTILKELFYRLCFGLLVIDGLRPIKRLNVKEINDITIREVTEKDLPTLQGIEEKLIAHLNDSPIFLNRAVQENTIEEFLDDDVKTLVVEKDKKLRSCMRGTLNKSDGCDILQTQGTLGINFAYTDPKDRGLGLATILLDELIKWGSLKDMHRCTVDCEAQNLEGTYFWMKYFNPVCYSIIRKIDDRIR
ncbi:MAG: GNAT family N-acetyltransferase [Promethearchaeota archaeon]